MERAADDLFILAMRKMDEAAMQRRSAGHFSDKDYRAKLEAKADGLRAEAFSLVSGRVTALPAASQ